MSSDFDSRRRRYRITGIAVGIVVLVLTVFLHFRDDSEPPPNPFLPPADPAAEAAYQAAAAEFKEAKSRASTAKTVFLRRLYAIYAYYPADFAIPTAPGALWQKDYDFDYCARQIPAAKRLLATCAEQQWRLDGSDRSLFFATCILHIAATNAAAKGRNDEALILLESHGPHRLNLLGSRWESLRAERLALPALAFADTDTGRIQRLLTLLDKTAPRPRDYTDALGIMYQNAQASIRKTDRQIRQNTPPSGTPGHLDLHESWKTAKACWLNLNRLPNATLYDYAEKLKAANKPYPEPIVSREYSWYEQNIGRNCGSRHRTPLPGMSYEDLFFRQTCTVYPTTETALIRAAIGIRLYELAHDGRRPDSLESLVPEHLSAVPRDPFDPKRPIAYDRSRCLLWSVSNNGKDDGGTTGSDWVLALPAEKPASPTGS